MMPLTLSPPLVLADADGDAAVVAGMASAIPAASAPVTFDFMVSPGKLVLLTIAERRTRRTRENTGLDTGLPGLRAPGPRRACLVSKEFVDTVAGEA
jgi:hypothetical protein